MTSLEEPRARSARLSPFEALVRLRAQIGEEALQRALEGASGVPSLHRRAVTRLLRREPSLAVLAGAVEDLAAHRLEWPAHGEAVRVGARFRGAAGLQIEGDADGTILDGAIIYDAAREVFLRVALRSEASASGTKRRRTEAGSARAEGSASGAAVVANWFRHPRGDRALGALHRDLGDFVLPAEIGTRPLRRGEDGPAQYVHVGWTGTVRIGGTMNLARSLFAAGAASALGVSTPWVMSVAEGSISWTGALEGTFDVLIFPLDASRVAVRLSKSSLSTRTSNVAASAEIAIEPPAKTAERVLGILFEPLDPLLRVLETERRRFTDLRALLREELTDDVEELLRSETITAQLREWLRRIGVDADLKRRLREIVLDVFDEASARHIDALREEIDPALVAARELVRRIRTVRRTVARAIEESVRVKVGLELARRRRALEEGSVLLECRLDPVADRAILDALVGGDWRPAIEAHRAGGELELTGTFRREGLLRVESELNVEIVGNEIGIGSLLRQQWEREITADGDLRLAARGTLEVWSRGWRSLRTIEALASTELLAAVAGETTLKRALRLEWSEQARPGVGALRALEERLVAAGLLAPGTRLEKDLAPEGERHSARPFGRLEITARLMLDQDALERIAGATPRVARTAFARMLAAEYAGASLVAQPDRAGLPLFAWPDVLARVERAAVNEKLSRVVFASEKGRGVAVRRELLPILVLLARLVLLFSALHRELRALLRHGRERENAAAIVRTQERMVAAMRPILTASTFRRSDLGFATLRALTELATEGDVAPRRDVVIRREDGTRFVYRAE